VEKEQRLSTCERNGEWDAEYHWCVPCEWEKVLVDEVIR
jgi:hypothetical protein